MPPKNVIVSSKLNQIVLRSVANRVRSKGPLNKMMWRDIAMEISDDFYPISVAEVEQIFLEKILPFLAERNYGVVDESTLEVIRNLPILIDSAEHESPAIECAEMFSFEEVSMSHMIPPNFTNEFEFEPFGTSTQFNQENDPLKTEPAEAASAKQASPSAHEAIEAWIEANCSEPQALPVLFPPSADTEPANGTPESDPIIFGGKQQTPRKASNLSKPAATQKPWKKFEFTDTDEISAPLTLPSSNEDKAEIITEDKLVPENKNESQPAKQSTKPQYSGEFQKILDNAIARRKAARKANRHLKLPVERNEENAVPKKKITWRDFAHLFPESEDEVTSSPKRRQPVEPKKLDLNEAPMFPSASNEAALEVVSTESPRKTVAVEAPKKKTWRDFDIADSD